MRPPEDCPLARPSHPHPHPPFSPCSLANICTPDLARDLAADILSILNSSRAYLRKKAILVLYKIFLKFPEALRPSFPRLKDKLEDTDPCMHRPHFPTPDTPPPG